MNRKQRKARAKHRSQERSGKPRPLKLSADAKMAAMLLPPVPKNVPAYSVHYYERFAGRLFQACANSHHRNCPRTTVDRGVGKHDHWYCICPCHRPDLTRHEKRKRMLKIRADLLKAASKARGLKIREPKLVRGADGKDRPSKKGMGSRGQYKKFRYVKAPDSVASGIMAIVHAAIAELKEGTVAEITASAIDNGLTKVTGQDPSMQTSIMLHRMLKAGVVEVSS